MVRLMLMRSPFKFLTGEVKIRELISATKCDLKRAFGTTNVLESTGQPPDCVFRPHDDLIKCPTKSQKKDDCVIDVTPPPIGYYDLGYCRPPCKPELMTCPPGTASSESIKKPKVCCVIKTSKFRINPCEKPKC